MNGVTLSVEMAAQVAVNAVMLAVAWGKFAARVAVLESKIEYLQSAIQALAKK